MTNLFAVCPDCGRKLQVRADVFPRHERGSGGKCTASGADAAVLVNVWMTQEMHRLRGRIERRASWWERDVQSLSVLEAIANNRDCRWALVTLVDGCFRVACTGTRDEIVSAQAGMMSALGFVPNGRGFARYSPSGEFVRCFPSTTRDENGGAVTWPSSLTAVGS